MSWWSLLISNLVMQSFATMHRYVANNNVLKPHLTYNWTYLKSTKKNVYIFNEIIHGFKWTSLFFSHGWEQQVL